MAWTDSNPVSIGDATKKSHYDTLWDNADELKDIIETIANGTVGVTASGDFEVDTDAIDTYATGTHEITPTMSDSGSVTLNTFYNKFWYTKIGNLVTITGYVKIESVDSPVGRLRLSVPYAATNDSQYYSGNAIGGASLDLPTGATWPFVFISSGNSYLEVWCGGDDVIPGEINWAANDVFYISLTYKTDS